MDDDLNPAALSYSLASPARLSSEEMLRRLEQSDREIAAGEVVSWDEVRAELLRDAAEATAVAERRSRG